MVISLRLKKLAKKKIKKMKWTYFRYGDIVNVQYFFKFRVMSFKGICIGVRYKSLLYKNCVFMLRNVYKKFGLEIMLSLYNINVLNLRVTHYEKKRFDYTKSKLYYLRYKLNRESLVRTFYL